MELSKISTAELNDFLVQIPAEIKRREKAEKAQILKDLEALAAERGFLLSDLFNDGKEMKVRVSVAVKYRHPNDVALTWTGRGRQPKWISAFLAEGGVLEQLAIQGLSEHASVAGAQQ
jgi:DNA-binding protein H-NS